MARLLAAALIAAPVHAAFVRLNHGIGLPTGVALNDLGVSPKVTQAPDAYPDLAGPGLQGLFQRQLGLHTCGWLSAVSSIPLTCPFGYVCATGSVFNVAACCDPARLPECYLPTRCVASSTISDCNTSCQRDPFVVKCSDSASPSCYTFAFDYGTATPTQIGCASSGFSQIIALSYTDGTETFTETNDLAATIDEVTTYPTSLFQNPPSSSIATTQISNSFFSGSEEESSSSSSTAVIAIQPATTTDPVPSTSAAEEEGDGGSGTNVGAIVGGVIGGLAVLAILTGVIVFMLLRHKRKKKAAAAAAGSTAPASSVSPSGPSKGPYPGTVSDYTSPPMSQYQYDGTSAYGPPSVAGTAPYGSQQTSPQSAFNNPNPHPQQTYTTPNHFIVEADSAPVMTGADGRPVHEAP